MSHLFINRVQINNKIMEEYTETSKLIPNGNTNRRKVYIRKILFYTVICASIIAFFILLLLYLLSIDGTPRKQMRRVNLEEVGRVTSNFANWTERDLKAVCKFSLQGNKCSPTPQTSKMSDDDDLPDAVDWRKKGVIGHVMDQLDCNICWQVSIVQVMESMVAIQRKATYVIPLSIQEMVDCSYRPTCCTGDVQQALWDMRKKHMSIVTEKQYPLSLKVEECQYKDDQFPKGVKIKDYRVNCDVTDKYIMGLISRHGPVIATVDSHLWRYYTDGIISDHCSGKNPDHVVQIVGYDRTGDIPYYIIKNSWGTDFGDNGYVYVEMGKNLCGIEDYISSLDVEY